MLTAVLGACLGDYQFIGFSLVELVDDLIELRYHGKPIGYVSKTQGRVEEVRQACKSYLRSHDFGNCN